MCDSEATLRCLELHVALWVQEFWRKAGRNQIPPFVSENSEVSEKIIRGWLCTDKIHTLQNRYIFFINLPWGQVCFPCRLHKHPSLEAKSDKAIYLYPSIVPEMQHSQNPSTHLSDNQQQLCEWNTSANMPILPVLHRFVLGMRNLLQDKLQVCMCVDTSSLTCSTSPASCDYIDTCTLQTQYQR